MFMNSIYSKLNIANKCQHVTCHPIYKIKLCDQDQNIYASVSIRYFCVCVCVCMCLWRISKCQRHDHSEDLIRLSLELQPKIRIICIRIYGKEISRQICAVKGITCLIYSKSLCVGFKLLQSHVFCSSSTGLIKQTSLKCEVRYLSFTHLIIFQFFFLFTPETTIIT